MHNYAFNFKFCAKDKCHFYFPTAKIMLAYSQCLRCMDQLIFCECFSRDECKNDASERVSNFMGLLLDVLQDTIFESLLQFFFDAFGSQLGLLISFNTSRSLHCWRNHSFLNYFFVLFSLFAFWKTKDQLIKQQNKLFLISSSRGPKIVFCERLKI